MAEARFLSTPRPNGEVIRLLECLLESARDGHIPTIHVVVVNPVNQAEDKAAGDLSELRTNALICGLAKASAKLVNPK